MHGNQWLDKPEVLALFWPRNRVLLGLRVCKSLRRHLLASATSVLLQAKGFSNVEAAPINTIVADLARFHRQELHICLSQQTELGSLLCREIGVGQCQLFHALVVAVTSQHVTTLQSLEITVAHTRRPYGSRRIHVEGSADWEDEHADMVPEGLAGLFEAIGGSCRLELLTVRALGIGAQTMLQLAPSLSSCLSLQHLDLCENGLAERGITALAEEISCCSMLQTLKLDANFCSPGGASSLAANLGACTRLACLSLASNYIQDQGAEALISVLSSCTELTSLNLAQNELCFAWTGGCPLARAIRCWPQLREIDLSCNGSEDGLCCVWESDLAPIVDALTTCSNLQSLSLAQLQVEEGGWLSASLGEMTFLRHLDLRDNYFEDDAVQELQEVVRGFSALSVLGLTP